ncbi:hypothetical protein Vretimale_4301 [Volvox reticuliferus]|uniref:Uncharacterized protein n=1 Tax=Volvox reticuliferus TaxID=1737510 RepID=A0A8J4G466_9CHLO|nr:hypothetical protein Vretimale_4301 [Volvox reticuliferus]
MRPNDTNGLFPTLSMKDCAATGAVRDASTSNVKSVHSESSAKNTAGRSGDQRTTSILPRETSGHTDTAGDMCTLCNVTVPLLCPETNNCGINGDTAMHVTQEGWGSALERLAIGDL